jgi:hypothetical protein
VGETVCWLRFSHSLEHDVRKFQENYEGFKLNLTGQLLVSTGDFNFLGENLRSIERKKLKYSP